MKYLKMMSLLILAITMVNCSDDDIPPPVADFTYDNTNGRKVTFNSEMSNVESFEWNFGDGEKSTEPNPVHVYDETSDVALKVTLNIVGKDGSISAVVKDVDVFESTEYLLTGGIDYTNGKTWKLKITNNESYAFGLVEPNLTTLINSPYGDLLESIGLGLAKGDSFTFYYDENEESIGDYMADNEDGRSLMALLYAVNNHYADIKAVSTDDDIPLADVAYTFDQAGAKWSINRDDFEVNAINFLTGQPEVVKFSGKTQLIIDGSYFGYKDASAIIIIKEIDNGQMEIAMSINLVEQVPDAPVLMFHMTLVAVN